MHDCVAFSPIPFVPNLNDFSFPPPLCLRWPEHEILLIQHKALKIRNQPVSGIDDCCWMMDESVLLKN